MLSETKINSSPCIGILAESKNVWERRVSVTPSDCKLLKSKGIKVVIQPSMTRCYSDAEYIESGAEISNNLSCANVILGIQNPDMRDLLENKTYLFFSHTRKGQTDNPTLLEQILEKKIRLIDYECIKENSENFIDAKRLVTFGRIAGIAGTINILKGIGELLLSRNISTPFIFTKLAHMYTCVEDAKESIITLGKYIQEQFLPEDLAPFTVAVLGTGRVNSGVLEALECLPHIKLTPKELLQNKIGKRRDLIYIVVFRPEDLYVRSEKLPKKENCLNTSFDKEDLFNNPENYYCNFNDIYLKYFHAIINCLYWEARFPKIFTKENLRKHVTDHDSKVLAISDISCDINGAIEILSEYTNYRRPFFIYEPVSKKIIYDIDLATKEGIIYHAIPNLASSFPEDASSNFSSLLLPFIEKLAFSEYPKKFDEQKDIPVELLRACVTSSGVLTPKYRNIFRNTEEKSRIISIQDKCDKPYFASFKIKGHIFDTGFFHELINIFPSYDVTQKINYLKIGENCDFPSVFYFDVCASNKENIKAFKSYMDEKKNIFNFEIDLMRTNIY